MITPPGSCKSIDLHHLLVNFWCRQWEAEPRGLENRNWKIEIGEQKRSRGLGETVVSLAEEVRRPHFDSLSRKWKLANCGSGQAVRATAGEFQQTKIPEDLELLADFGADEEPESILTKFLERESCILQNFEKQSPRKVPRMYRNHESLAIRMFENQMGTCLAGP